MSNVRITIKDVGKSYGNKVIFDNVNFSFESGKIYGFYGPSGCGKTTLLNIIGLLDKKFQGKYDLDNEDISLLDEAELSLKRKNMFGYIFQNYNLINNLTVYENIFLEIDSNDRVKLEQRLEMLLTKFKINDLLYVKCKILSGGEKQRVGLIKAIITNPKIILADEPTGSLDDKNKLLTMNIFKELKKEDVCIIFVSHDISTLDYCDYAYKFNNRGIEVII